MLDVTHTSHRETGCVWIVSRCSWTLYNFRLGLIRGLQSQNIPTLTMGAKRNGFEGKLRDTGVSFEELPVAGRGINPLMDLRLLTRLFYLMRRRRPALVHLFTIKPVIYGGLAARFTGVPAIVTVTGLGYVFTSGNRLLRLVIEWLYRRALKHVKVVFFQNADDKELFIQRHLVSPGQAQLVPGSGVDLKRFEFVEPRKAASTVVFLMVARLIREKGVLEYLAAAKRVCDDNKNVRCLLIGAPDEVNPTSLSAVDIERLTKLAGVKWVGAVEDVRPCIAQADVVILPSYREGIPRSLLEAAAMGRALITSDAVGCREVVDQEVNGLLVPPRDVDALVGAMRRFVQEPNLIVKFGVASREKAVREFDERIVINRTLEAYRELGIDLGIQQCSL